MELNRAWVNNLPASLRKYFIPGLVIVLLLIIGYLSLDHLRNKRDQEVSANSWQLAKAISDREFEPAQDLYLQLKDTATNDQLVFATLLMAAGHFNNGDFEPAAALYQNVIDTSLFVSLRDIARLRLTLTLIKLRQAKRAREILSNIENRQPIMEAMTEDLYGDAYRLDRKPVQAIESYLNAIKLVANFRQMEDFSNLMREKIALVSTAELIAKSNPELTGNETKKSLADETEPASVPKQ